MKQIGEEIEEMTEFTPEVLDNIERVNTLLRGINNSFRDIANINLKSKNLKGEIDVDMRDELAEYRNYIEDLFNTLRFPFDYNDKDFSKRTGGLKQGP